MSLSRRQFWLLLGVETAALLAVTAWILSRLGRLTEPSALVVAAAIVAIGDLVSVMIMQRIAPTKITLEPGEQSQRVARAVDDFDDDGRGVVFLRGERWGAQLNGPGRIRAGSKVRIVSRAGLTLLVERVD